MQIGGAELASLQFETVGSWPIAIRRIIFVIVFLAAAVIGYLVDSSELINILNITQNERMNLQTTYARIHHQAVNLEAYRAQVAEVQNQLDAITQQLPTSSAEASLLEEISTQAAASGLQFRSINPLGEEFKGIFKDRPYEIALHGSYNSLGEFVSNITSLQRIVTLHDFFIKSVKPGTGELDIVLVAKTYWTEPHERKVQATPGMNVQKPGSRSQ